MECLARACLWTLTQRSLRALGIASLVVFFVSPTHPTTTCCPPLNIDMTAVRSAVCHHLAGPAKACTHTHAQQHNTHTRTHTRRRQTGHRGLVASRHCTETMVAAHSCGCALDDDDDATYVPSAAAHSLPRFISRSAAAAAVLCCPSKVLLYTEGQTRAGCWVPCHREKSALHATHTSRGSPTAIT